jgi:hypothetical protein
MRVDWKRCPLCGDTQEGKCRWALYGGYRRVVCENTNKVIDLNLNFEKYENWPEIAGYISNNISSGSTISEYLPRELEPYEVPIDEITSKIPKKMDQLYTLLSYMERNLKNVFLTEPLNIPPYVVYCENEDEVSGHFETLVDLGYIKGGDYWYCLTARGLEKIEELRKSNKDSNKVFIAMGFNTRYSELIRNAVKKGCIGLDLVAESVDEKEYVGDINDRIISEINRSRFVVADYTGNNYGVYYESGYARGRGIIVIETCNRMWLNDDDDFGVPHKLHFDVEHRNMIMWKDEDDLCAKVRDRIGSLL